MPDISSNFVLPGAVICPDISGNVIPRDCCPAVIIAPRTGGTATDYQLNAVATDGLASELFGAGSPAATAASHYLQANPFGELLVMSYTATGAAAAGGISVLGGTADENSTEFLNIGGRIITVQILVGDTAQDVRLAIADEINSLPLPVSAAVNGNNVELTSGFLGETGNQIQISIEGGGGTVGGILGGGIVLGVIPMTGGTGLVDVAQATESLGDCCCYDFVAFTDQNTVVMDQFESWFEGRWGCECFIGGRYYSTFRGDFTEVVTYLDERTDRFASSPIICETEPANDYDILGSFIGATHMRRCESVSRSWYKAELTGIENSGGASCGESCFSKTERNLIALKGGTTLIDGPGAFQIVEADFGLGALTADGEIDTFLRFPQAAYQTMDVARLFSQFIDDNYDNVLIVANGTFVSQGSNVVTPNMITAEIKAFFQGLEGTIVENADQLDEFIRVEIDEQNPSRVDACVFFDLTSALRTFSVKLSPRISLGV